MPALRAAGMTEMPTGIRPPVPGVPAQSAHPPGVRNRQRAGIAPLAPERCGTRVRTPCSASRGLRVSQQLPPL
eukprot:8259841-Alexandrium_andersonii.AAC.1